MIEAMGLKIIASRSPSMASPAYHISWKSTYQLKGGTHKQTDWLIDKPILIYESGLKEINNCSLERVIIIQSIQNSA
jgi:hypothetical protein